MLITRDLFSYVSFCSYSWAVMTVIGLATTGYITVRRVDKGDPDRLFHGMFLSAVVPPHPLCAGDLTDTVL